MGSSDTVSGGGGIVAFLDGEGGFSELGGAVVMLYRFVGICSGFWFSIL